MRNARLLKEIRSWQYRLYRRTSHGTGLPRLGGSPHLDDRPRVVARGSLWLTAIRVQLQHPHPLGVETRQSGALCGPALRVSHRLWELRQAPLSNTQHHRIAIGTLQHCRGGHPQAGWSCADSCHHPKGSHPDDQRLLGCQSHSSGCPRFLFRHVKGRSMNKIDEPTHHHKNAGAVVVVQSTSALARIRVLATGEQFWVKRTELVSAR
jgi:hypothetical protein